MKTHQLKVWPEYYERMKSGQKTFEVRKNDRDFQTGDELMLDCWDPIEKQYTDDDTIVKRIAYVLYGGQFGIEQGYCVLGLVDGTPFDKVMEVK